ncbi:MAG: tRNA (5-methylaminomethyl-2-thiouridylate)-methyltransferase [Candidatus Electronema aureum]|uniref:tRNA-specific 2-thiouridylase MnmA n=1 Tax=Candidatus Electronema aureum TaxID=2005002 RepID=A0A521G5P6_9BACT|nr:MAG: tRNA (5-methylaminomethyl-2-thiouridylate)-methyltransferase [Candidatus Electronema aureum]
MLLFPRNIGIALSGGVDSTIAVALLLEQGFAVQGFFMLLLPDSEQQVGKVQNIADRLGIPLHLVDRREQFQQQIIASFTATYRQGLTPNPCIICNRLIKFGLLLEAMAAKSMDAMATGHYARVESGSLRRGLDSAKDQSYFLCRLTAKQLSRLILPLGTWRKQDVFARARAMGFSNFEEGGESQDVCFLAGQDLAGFLDQQGIEARSGEIITEQGKVLGSHQGIWNYTVGQRRGLGLPDATPWYVTGLDAERNVVIVGKNQELFQRELLLADMQWQIEPSEQWQGRVQLRSRHQAAEAKAVPTENGCWRVFFKEPQRAITPGQFAVLYEDDQVVGSGVIQHHPLLAIYPDDILHHLS